MTIDTLYKQSSPWGTAFHMPWSPPGTKAALFHGDSQSSQPLHQINYSTICLCQNSIEKMAVYSEVSHQTWWFSILMLVYQRVAWPYANANKRFWNTICAELRGTFRNVSLRMKWIHLFSHTLFAILTGRTWFVTMRRRKATSPSNHHKFSWNCIKYHSTTLKSHSLPILVGAVSISKLPSQSPWGNNHPTLYRRAWEPINRPINIRSAETWGGALLEDAKCERGSGIVVRSSLWTKHLNKSKTLSHISIFIGISWYFWLQADRL